MTDMKLEYVAISSLIRDPSNSRTHSKKNLQAIMGSLTKFGQQKPIVIDAKNMIIAGNGTTDGAEALKWTHLWALRSSLAGSEAIAYAIADNRTGELAEWDSDNLTKTLEALKKENFDLEGIGFDSDDLEKILPTVFEGQCDEDEVPEQVEAKTKLGDLYQLGEHRLLCGDSTDVLHVDNLINSNIDICFTSPPYNVGKTIRGNLYESDDDNKTCEEYRDFLLAFTGICLTKCTYSFINIQMLGSNRLSILDYQYQLRNHLKDILIWNKKISPPHINKGTFSTKFEFIFCFSNDAKGRAFPCSWQGKYSNVIETESNSGNEFAKIHKAGFPVAFPTWIIEKMDFAKSVYDPFMGTGSTMIACEKTNRKCYGMEIDPHYCDVIVARWEKYTGKKAELIGK